MLHWRSGVRILIIQVQSNKLVAMELARMRRTEVRQCAELAARAFHTYDYFTLFFEDVEVRMRYLQTIIASEFRANYRSANLLVLKDNGRIVAVAQLHAPDYKKPSDLKYLLSGFTKIYRVADKQNIDNWLAMDADAAKPCHEMEKDAWYLSSLVVDPQCQHQHYGSRMIEEKLVPFIKQRGGSRLALFTNAEGNCKFYESLGFVQFHSTTIAYGGKIMGSWSYVKNI